ncbi:unnamed protein product [Rhizophagus irregularis]|nr:unnamed protein product [Rhizophagus irregularis]
MTDKQLSGQNPASSIFSLSGLLFIRPSLRSLFFTSSFRFIFSPSSLIFIRPSLRFLFFTSDSFRSIFSPSRCVGWVGRVWVGSVGWECGLGVCGLGAWVGSVWVGSVGWERGLGVWVGSVGLEYGLGVWVGSVWDPSLRFPLGLSSFCQGFLFIRSPLRSLFFTSSFRSIYSLSRFSLY